MVVQEVKEIIEKLGAPEEFNELINSFYTNRIEKIFLVLTGIFIFCFVIAFFVPYTKPYSIWLLVIGFISIMLYSLSSFVSQAKYLLTPTKSYISDLSQRMSNEKKVALDLSIYSSQSILMARERLEYEKSQLEKRIGFLIGVLEKLGIVPAVIALYIGYAKAMKDPQLENVPEFALAAIAGLYLGAFLVKSMTSKLSLMCVILKDAHSLAEQKESIEQEIKNEIFSSS